MEDRIQKNKYKNINLPAIPFFGVLLRRNNSTSLVFALNFLSKSDFSLFTRFKFSFASAT